MLPNLDFQFYCFILQRKESFLISTLSQRGYLPPLYQTKRPKLTLCCKSHTLQGCRIRQPLNVVCSNVSLAPLKSHSLTKLIFLLLMNVKVMFEMSHLQICLNISCLLYEQRPHNVGKNQNFSIFGGVKSQCSHIQIFIFIALLCIEKCLM